MHQGGLYYNNNLIHGILLVNNEFGGLGHFHDRVLITRLARQTNDKRSTLSTVVKVASNTLKCQAMIGLVISRDFQKLPVAFQGDEKFGVSGFWHLSCVFAVVSEGPKESETHIDLMACLIYSGSRETMWWTAADADTAGNTMNVLKEGETFDQRFRKKSCSTCNSSSLTIFQEGWICTNVTCTKVGKTHSGHALQTKTYLEQFLQPWVSPHQLAQVCPPLLPERSDEKQLTDDKDENLKIMRDHWRGWVCSVCRTMNRRKQYHKLVCPCGESFLSSPPHVRLDQVAGKEFLTLNADDKLPHKSIKDASVKLIQMEFTEMFAIYTWEFGPEARVMGLYPRAVAHEGPRGNDKIFGELQEKMGSGAIPLARAGFIDDTGRKSFTRHFCANFGHQYNASMDISTTPFERADPLMTELVHKAKAIVLDRFSVDVDLNEALCLAYLPEMAISWHDDGEPGLGDTVISSSFGADTTMKFAMKGNYWAGRKPTIKDTVMLTPGDLHLPGCLRMEERRVLLQKVQSGELTKDDYESQLKEVVKGNKVTRDAVSPTLLSLTIPHGGYIIMSGENMQKYYKVSTIKIVWHFSADL